MTPLIWVKNIYTGCIIFLLNIPILIWGYLIPFRLLKNIKISLLFLYVIPSLILALCFIIAIMPLLLKHIDKYKRKLLILVPASLCVLSSFIFLINLYNLHMILLILTVIISTFITIIYVTEIIRFNLGYKLIVISIITLFFGNLLYLINQHFIVGINSNFIIVKLIFMGFSLIYFVAALLIFPESPVWLIKSGYEQLAIKELIRLRGYNYHVELAEIKSKNIKLDVNDRSKLYSKACKDILILIISLIILMAYFFNYTK